jgi:ribulose-phosphate 3-epimerase
MTGIKLSVSLAAAPLFDLKSVVDVLNDTPVDMLHFDVEDGVFIPDLTLGTKLISDLRPFSNLLFDVHLSIAHPERFIPDVIGRGADRVCVHWEACPYPMRTLSMIKESGAAAGLAFNPRTNLPDLSYLLSVLDFVNVLSTEPAARNSMFIPTMADKMEQNKPLHPPGALEWVLDGGIDPNNIQGAVQKGADTLVVGRSVFTNGDIRTNILSLREGISCTSSSSS